MPKIYYEQDADLNALKGKTIAVIGYGNQGRNQALNLKDSGISVIIGARSEKTKAQAKADGIPAYDAKEAAAKADIIQILIQDGVDLGAAADAGFAYGGAVDAGVGLDLDVVFEDGGARLRHFVPGAVALFGITKAVGADDGAVLQDDAIAYAAVFADDGMGVGEEVVADFDALIDGDEAVEDGVVADLDVFVYEAIRADVGAFGNAGGACDDGGFMDAGGVLRCVVEEFDSVGEGEVRIAGA